jgi:hypothetical protein
MPTLQAAAGVDVEIRMQVKLQNTKVKMQNPAGTSTRSGLSDLTFVFCILTYPRPLNEHVSPAPNP